MRKCLQKVCFFILIFLIFIFNSCSTKNSANLYYYKIDNINIFISKKINKNDADKYYKNFKYTINNFFSSIINNFNITEREISIFLVDKTFLEITKKDIGFIKSKIKDKNKKKYFEKILEDKVYSKDKNIHILSVFYFDYIFIKKLDFNVKIDKTIDYYFYKGTIYNLIDILILDNMPEDYKSYLVKLKYDIYNNAKFCKTETNVINFFNASISSFVLHYISVTKNFIIDKKSIKNIYLEDEIFKKVKDYYKKSINVKDIKNLNYLIKYETYSEYLYMYMIINFPLFIIEKYGENIFLKFINYLISYKYKNPDDLVIHTFGINFEKLLKKYEEYLKKN